MHQGRTAVKWTHLKISFALHRSPSWTPCVQMTPFCFFLLCLDIGQEVTNKFPKEWESTPSLCLFPTIIFCDSVPNSITSTYIYPSGPHVEQKVWEIQYPMHSLSFEESVTPNKSGKVKSTRLLMEPCLPWRSFAWHFSSFVEVLGLFKWEGFRFSALLVSGLTTLCLANISSEENMR